MTVMEASIAYFTYLWSHHVRQELPYCHQSHD